MKTRNLLITLLTIVLTTAIVNAEDKPAEELSNTRRAEVTLRITTDPKTFPMGKEEGNIQRLTRLMFRQDVSQAAWQEIIDTSDLNDFVTVSLEEPVEVGGLQTVQIGLMILLKDNQRPAAKEFLEAYIKKLKSALHKEYDLARELYINKHRGYAAQKHSAENHLRNLLSKQNNISDKTLDKESVRRRILEHEKAKVENGMQMAILQKRAAELVMQISEANITTDEIEAIRAAIEEFQVKWHCMRAEYKKIEFDRDQGVKNNDTTKVKINEMTELLSSVEKEINQVDREINKLSKREEELGIQTAGDIQVLNRQLRETTMQLEELRIKDSYLHGYSPGSLSDSAEYEMLEAEIEAARENLKRALIEEREFVLQIELLQSPTVSYDKIMCPETVVDDDG